MIMAMVGAAMAPRAPSPAAQGRARTPGADHVAALATAVEAGRVVEALGEFHHPEFTLQENLLPPLLDRTASIAHAERIGALPACWSAMHRYRMACRVAPARRQRPPCEGGRAAAPAR
ncbi:hypothetical protein BKE38_11520 [Pseudoroseomonas deserti]|uniref:Uncharacterized protein n=1 Tax=Teichococcus deserti TaxID=1817963 RepID=A0A1V2H2H1_9PROT|nr:hypothetical protein [Pseudoroseomonas deserti]ONG53786.1 hypothetical protein BKE38_11520 [Pseudoroseomonas deserti]